MIMPALHEPVARRSEKYASVPRLPLDFDRNDMPASRFQGTCDALCQHKNRIEIGRRHIMLGIKWDPDANARWHICWIQMTGHLELEHYAIKMVRGSRDMPKVMVVDAVVLSCDCRRCCFNHFRLFSQWFCTGNVGGGVAWGWGATGEDKHGCTCGRRSAFELTVGWRWRGRGGGEHVTVFSICFGQPLTMVEPRLNHGLAPNAALGANIQKI